MVPEAQTIHHCIVVFIAPTPTYLTLLALEKSFFWDHVLGSYFGIVSRDRLRDMINYGYVISLIGVESIAVSYFFIYIGLSFAFKLPIY